MFLAVLLAPLAIAPHLTTGQARVQVEARFGVELLEPPRAVELEILGRSVPAFEARLPFEPGPVPHLRTVFVGARTGSVLEIRDAVFASHVRVFVQDPITTPDATDIELSTLDVDEADLPLTSDVFSVAGCTTEPVGEPPRWWAPPACAPVARARSDEDGNFVPPLPDVGRIEDNMAIDDAYAEVAAYRAIENFFATLEARGLSSRRCEHFVVVVNDHRKDDDGEVVPNNNASFVDTCDPDVAPQVIMGQGTDADYAWDADILYHELGHSVVQDLTPGGLLRRRYAEWGIASEAGVINEGIADYFAMSVSDDPEVGEYIGRISVASGTPYLRTGENTAVFPDDMIGDWHSDSRVVSAALWATRRRVGPSVDTLVLRTLPTLPPDALVSELAAGLLSEAQVMRGEGQLDDFAIELLHRALDSRGMITASHVIDDPALTTTGKQMRLAAAEDPIVPFAPGPFQLRYHVPQDATEVTLFFATNSGTEEEPARARFLVKHADEPIAFEYTFLEGTQERIEVAGDYDEDLPAESLNGEDFIARLKVEPGEILHVALANDSRQGAAVGNFFVVASEPAKDGDEDEDEPGCGCRSADPRGSWLLISLLVLGLHQPSNRRRHRVR